jgi:hypothetical protein
VPHRQRHIGPSDPTTTPAPLPLRATTSARPVAMPTAPRPRSSSATATIRLLAALPLIVCCGSEGSHVRRPSFIDVANSHAAGRWRGWAVAARVGQRRGPLTGLARSETRCGDDRTLLTIQNQVGWAMAIAPRRMRWVVVAGVAVLCMSAPAVGQTTNQPPQCPADPTLTVSSGQPLVLPGSPCSDPEGQPVTLILVVGPRYGVLSDPAADGSRTYTSNPGYVGTDLIRFKATDGSSESAVSTLTIRVVGQGGGGSGGPPAGRIQQQVEAGAMLSGQRLQIWVYVSELAAGQEVSVPDRTVRTGPGSRSGVRPRRRRLRLRCPRRAALQHGHAASQVHRRNAGQVHAYQPHRPLRGERHRRHRRAPAAQGRPYRGARGRI